MEITYEKLLKVLKSNLILILACGIIVAALAFAYAHFVVVPVYYSNTKMIITSSDYLPSTQTEINYSRLAVATQLEILNSTDFFEDVRATIAARYPEIGTFYSAAQLKSRTTFSQSGTTECIVITFKSPEEGNVKKIVDCMEEAVEKRFLAIYKNQDDVSVFVLDSASPAAISNDNAITMTAIGAFAGAIITFAIVFLKDMLDIRIKTSEELMAMYGIPVLGAVPTFNNKREIREERV